MVAVVPVRDGTLPAGATEVIGEAGGQAVLAGSGTAPAAAGLAGPGTVTCAELGTYAPAGWASALAPLLREADVVLLPASPDGRDLAPRLAHTLGRPLLAGAVSATLARVVVARQGGRVGETHDLVGPVVATLLPGVRGTDTVPGRPEVRAAPATGAPRRAADAEVVQVLPPDPLTMDLAESPRVLTGGAGLGGADRFVVLARVAAALGCSPGATRVVADAGWVPAHRYIGTTGVSVDPDLYVALGVSGAVQHVTGIGRPRHVVAVNTDPSAPMMAMADLALVTDAPSLLDELAARLGEEGSGTTTATTP